MSNKVVPTDVHIDVVALSRGINRLASLEGELVVKNAMLVGRYEDEAGQPTPMLLLVLAAEYHGAMVAYPRAIEEGLVRRLEEAGKPA